MVPHRLPKPKPRPLHAVMTGEPHLIVPDLAARWRCNEDTIRRNYRAWGLKPLKFGKNLLFPVAQVIAIEQRQMNSDAAE